MLLTILIIIVALIATILIFAATRPNNFRMQRSIYIEAPALEIFPLINDFKLWGSWSPYETIDPHMKRSYSGAAAGKGSVYAFEGNAKVGTGQLEIVETREPSLVRISLEMIKPIKGHNIIDFTFAPKDTGTEVTWAMDGKRAYIFKVMGLFINMEKMLGPVLQQGLASLKTLAEQPRH